jgi:hypothetical protein
MISTALTPDRYPERMCAKRRLIVRTHRVTRTVATTRRGPLKPVPLHRFLETTKTLFGSGGDAGSLAPLVVSVETMRARIIRQIRPAADRRFASERDLSATG